MKKTLHRGIWVDDLGEPFEDDEPGWDEVIPYVPTGIEDETWTCVPVGGEKPSSFEVRNDRGQIVAIVPVDEMLAAEIAEGLATAIARLPEMLRQMEDQTFRT